MVAVTEVAAIVSGRILTLVKKTYVVVVHTPRISNYVQPIVFYVFFSSEININYMKIHTLNITDKTVGLG